jgi:hypothetical protein
MSDLPAPLSTTPHPGSWSLTVACYGGLSNRLRVLLSGVALAEATGRRFTMLWPVRPVSGAPFHDLFENDWNVITQNPPPPRETWLPALDANLGRDWVDFTASTQADIAVSSPTWLIDPAIWPHHAPLWQRCGELFEQLRPVPSVRDRVAAFQLDHFRPDMLGVHLRRGEFVRKFPFSARNTRPAIAAIRRFLKQYPDAGVYLSTDDGAPDPFSGRVLYEGVREKLRAEFGDRVVWAEQRTLENGAVAGVQDALVDLLLLRSTNAVVGTWFSSFSEMAAFGRGVPLVYCKSDGYWGAVDWALRTVGVVSWLRRQSRVKYQGRVHPLSLLEYYLRSPRRILARETRKYAPGLFRRIQARVRWE